MRFPSQTPAVVILFKERWQTPAVLHDALPLIGGEAQSAWRA